MNEYQDGPCVYFISDGQGHVKIGIASNLKARLNVLQVGSPYELSVIRAEYTETIREAEMQEREYHTLFSAERIRGEWYNQRAVEKYLQDKKDPEVQPLPDVDFNILAKHYFIYLESKNKEDYIHRVQTELPKGYVREWLKGKMIRKGVEEAEAEMMLDCAGLKVE